jgi:DNA-directed RNA polymerase subunit N (RpoN/RPB10)
MSTCPRCHPRYCAPARCYCGHPECPAYDTYVPRISTETTRKDTSDGLGDHRTL